MAMRFLPLVAALMCASSVFAQTTEQSARSSACPSARRIEAQSRLEQLRDEDQSDRAGQMRAGIDQRDLERRREVASLFAEGCFSTGRDYHNAALIFQHGTVPEHYYQAWLFARRAVELGDEDAQWLVPRAVDRYLMNTGYKQVFATNLVTDSWFLGEQSSGAWCVWPTVASLTDRERTAAGGSALSTQIERARAMNQARGGQGDVCTVDVPDPPRGLFPGTW